MKRRKWQLVLIGLGLSIACSPGYQDVPGSLKNPGFETGKVRESPEGWLNGGGFAGYPAEVTDQSPERGRLCGLLYTDPTSKVRDYGVLSQMVDTAAFRNKETRLRIFARTVTAPNSWAAVFYRVDRAGNQKPVYMNLRIAGEQWRRYDLFVKVPNDAIRMQFGVTLTGEGKLWVDDASIASVVP